MSEQASSEKTWRVVDDRGEVHMVKVAPARCPSEWYVSIPEAHHSIASRTERGAVMSFAERYFDVVELRGPGERTTAEQIADVETRCEVPRALLERCETPPTDAEIAAPKTELFRVICTKGVMREVLVSRVRAARNGIPARWLIIYGRVDEEVDLDENASPQRAICTWARFPIREIVGPGEKTTAEQLEALKAERDALEAALRNVALTCGRCRSRHATGLANAGGSYDEFCDNCAGHRDVQSFAPSDHADVLRSLDRSVDESTGGQER